MIKQVLKKIFPRAFLKKVFLEYNKFRINTIDQILFPEYNLNDKDFVIRRDEYPFRLIPVQKDHLEQRLFKQFTDNDTWTQDEYLIVFDKPCLIEPDYGWAITEGNKLIYPSLGFSRAPYVPKPALRRLFLKGNVKEVDEIISFRDTGEENYFHFYNDVLPKLFFLEERLDLPSNIPILISSKLFSKPYFQYFLQHSYLKNREWIIQDNEIVRARKTYFCKPLTHSKIYYNRILELIPDFTQNEEGSKKIFITRSPKRLRFIQNTPEIEDICRNNGFEIIDFDEISLEEQMQLFAQTRYAIGIHGAGLTNMIFRRGKPMSVLEIFPPGGYFPFHYVLLATQFGYLYDGVIGEKSNEEFSGGFRLDPTVFQAKIEFLLKRGY